MAVSFSLRDIFTAAELAALKVSLGAATAVDLDAAMTKLSKASLREVADVILGVYPARTGEEITERRILHLIKYFYADTIPSERDLTHLLRLTEASATKFLVNMSARHPDLRGAFIATVHALFDAKTPGADGHQVTIISKNLITWLRSQASSVAPTFGAIAKVRNTNDRYSIPIDTYNALCASLGLVP